MDASAGAGVRVRADSGGVSGGGAGDDGGTVVPAGILLRVSGFGRRVFDEELLKRAVRMDIKPMEFRKW